MSKIHFAKENFVEASKCSRQAQSKYWNCQNLTAYFEALYLDSLSCFNLKNFDDAEQKLRHLLNIANENESAFHTANAYSLLGMIFMNKGDFTRAKSFLEESVRHELKNNRLDGLVSDYINLGLVAQKSGHPSEAQKYFAEAKNYAEQIQDLSLLAMVENYINTDKSA